MFPSPVRLAVVDDHVLFRKLLKSFLSDQKNIQINISVSDVYELLNQLKACPVDIVLMDIFMPGIDGIDGFKLIRNQYPDMKILIVSMSTDIAMISDLLDLGIHGYVAKSDEPEELLLAVHSIFEGRLYRNKHFTDALYWNKQMGIRPDNQKKKDELNDRDKKVLQLIWEEKNNKEIANEMYLSTRSIEKIRQDMKEKIGVKSTVGLLKYAMKQNIIKPVLDTPTQ
jgi:DNA-binding NarL/FixJ family response regulator